MATVAERLQQARAALESAGLSPADAALDAEVLSRHLLRWDRAALLARGRDPEPPGFARELDALIRRRAAREPVAQIVGHREFWGLEFEVSRDVLVPRPETELVVEEAIRSARESGARSAIDVGTGSGCIAIAVAHELPRLRLTATDTSGAALALARRNAAHHGVDARIRFVRTDLLNGVSGPADLILSNPPYVPDGEAAGLQPEVLEFEPGTALFGGPDGLSIIRRLLDDSPARLAPGGRLIVEFGFGQEARVRALAEQKGWQVIGVRQDLQAIPRTIVLTRSAHG